MSLHGALKTQRTKLLQRKVHKQLSSLVARVTRCPLTTFYSMSSVNSGSRWEKPCNSGILGEKKKWLTSAVTSKVWPALGWPLACEQYKVRDMNYKLMWWITGWWGEFSWTFLAKIKMAVHVLFKKKLSGSCIRSQTLLPSCMFSLCWNSKQPQSHFPLWLTSERKGRSAWILLHWSANLYKSFGSDAGNFSRLTL